MTPTQNQDHITNPLVYANEQVEQLFFAQKINKSLLGFRSASILLASKGAHSLAFMHSNGSQYQGSYAHIDQVGMR